MEDLGLRARPFGDPRRTGGSKYRGEYLRLFGEAAQGHVTLSRSEGSPALRAGILRWTLRHSE
jgi:hypothetical protein